MQARVRRQVRAFLSVAFLFFVARCLLLSPERRQIFFKVAHQRFREFRSFRTLRLRFKSGFKSGSNGAFGLVFGLVYLDLPTLLTLMVGLDRRQHAQLGLACLVLHSEDKNSMPWSSCVQVDSKIKNLTQLF